MSKYKFIVDPRLDIEFLRENFSKEAEFLSLADAAQLLGADVILADFDNDLEIN
ncbi:MAG: hypothetical protein U9O78_04015 [Patescibacteria group bacterium]|nr:hypothetical protein [Patescibacteria group bacterium]